MGNCVSKSKTNVIKNSSRRTGALRQLTNEVERRSHLTTAANDLVVEDLEMQQEASTLVTPDYPSVSSNVIEGCKALAQRTMLTLPPSMSGLTRRTENEDNFHYSTRRIIEVEPMQLSSDIFRQSADQAGAGWTIASKRQFPFPGVQQSSSQGSRPNGRSLPAANTTSKERFPSFFNS